MTQAACNKLKRVRHAILACSALTAAILAVGSARAENAARIRTFDFTTQNVYNQVINVVSTDNQRWSEIEPGNVSFGAHVNIDTRVGGSVRRVGIVLGQCGGAACNGKPLLWQASPDTNAYENQMAVTFPTSKIPVSSETGIATVPAGDEIVSRCNANLTLGGTQQHSFDYLMPATFVADTYTGRNENGLGDGTLPPQWIGDVDHAMTKSFLVKVVCKPFQRENAADGVVAEQPKEIKVGTIELFRSTYVGQTSQPNPATVCKKARLLVRLTTNKTGPVKFKLWTKIGDAPMTSKFIEAWSAHAGPGQYKAEYAEWVEVTKTSYVQAMAEDKTNPIGQSTGWKDITLHCTGAGGGGLADVPNTSNPDNDAAPTPLKVTGELTLADKADAPKDKPRLGQAVFKIWANKPGATSYRLTCSGGRQWEGTLPTFKVGNHKYQAVGAANFQISKTEQIDCALRSTSLPKKDVIALASKLFELVKRNPKLDPADGLVERPRPTPPTHQGRVPGVKVAPESTLVCIGGKAAGVTCFCPARTSKVQFGPHRYRCVTNVVAPKRPAVEQPHQARPNRFIGPKREGSARPLGPRESAIGARRFLR
ncbi:MAG: hypothetical protein M5U07_15910 [Xanthobacteraceae bacterium]|nr:hypothetical protein [Xanthobacteraceae bacterium]